jgi:hypothetical protein
MQSVASYKNSGRLSALPEQPKDMVELGDAIGEREDSPDPKSSPAGKGRRRK